MNCSKMTENKYIHNRDATKWLYIQQKLINIFYQTSGNKNKNCDCLLSNQ